MDRYSGKTVLITAGAKGKGAEETKFWIEGGGRVLIGDVDDDAGIALAPELGDRPPTSIWM